MIKDNFNRVHNYLRISLTDNCNLRCFYCMPEESYDFTPPRHLMQVQEIESIARVFVSLGVNKIRLTGGEPLVRKDAADIVRGLAALPVNLTMTTNGTRLHEFTGLLRECGITSLNISLDTLQKDKFLLMTKRDQFDRVRENIDRMIEMGFHVKVNMVVTKGINDDEIEDFVRWTKDQPVHVRFIEFMPFTGNKWDSKKVVGWQEIVDQVRASFDIAPLEREQHATARKFRAQGHAGTFAVISTMTAPFCGDCNRLRLTADGKMKNCLFSKTETNLLQSFREGKDIVPLILGCIRDKKEELGGQFHSGPETVVASQIENRSMITIGG